MIWRWLTLTAAATMALNNKQHAAEADSAAPETAVFGGGCFWCVEAVFERVKGVKNAVSGYAGGAVPYPSYEKVCRGNTGHAEVARVEFDPAETSYEQLLDAFWRMHDPTALNRQGADIGTQYRSIILYAGGKQLKAALASRERAQRQFAKPIVTEIAPLKEFYPAEKYHQDYFRKHPDAPYCVTAIRPKLEKMKNNP